RRYVGVTAGQRSSLHPVSVVPGIVDVGAATGLVIAFAQRSGTHVAGTGGADTHLIVYRPVARHFPRPDIAGPGVVGPTGSGVHFQHLHERHVGQQRPVELGERFLDVVAAFDGAQ